ncbi:alpha/beta hydrolase [Microbacterium sp. KUDC0406]|uniref:alpha/beta fold hydrolase n=1 Tax=Microbacterium sp. KUDC0406 TaxID=2909588 RepID=UPI001F25CA72|nr:alpha/beta fold hydrolase [Microbacterium sp. KUDC0406]UJP09910.1 alpha/beta hydrolase [Microbacterium sp. KUDC0406]
MTGMPGSPAAAEGPSAWGDGFEHRMADAQRQDAAIGPRDWAAWPAEAERGTIEAPSGPLAHVAMGPPDGERVLLVPGMTGSKEDFALMMPLLAASGYRAESYDLAGQYESFRAGPERLQPPQQRYSLELFVADLIAVLEQADTPAHVLGYSFAGTVASAALAERPEPFATLTLLSAPPVAGQALRGFKVLGRVSWAVPGRALGPVFIAALRHNVHRAPEDRAAFVTARFALTRRRSVGDILALMKRTPDLDERLRTSGVPILVAAGARDVWPDAAHRAFAARIDARLLVLPTGHSPCETAPHQLTVAMLDLFRSGR